VQEIARREKPCQEMQDSLSLAGNSIGWDQLQPVGASVFVVGSECLAIMLLAWVASVFPTPATPFIQ